MLSLSILLAATRLGTETFAAWPTSVPVQAEVDERHLKNLRQLTFGGQNAEAYWAADGKTITWQSMQPGFPDEQIFTMGPDGSGKRLISTGKGRCTCSYFTPDHKWVYFSSTHEKNPGAQEKVDMSKGYTWRVNNQFSMYRAHPDGSSLTKILDLNGYVAETTIAPNGKFLVFTSDFEGDLEIYRADLDGKNLKRLTHEPGYDGGPFISWDSKKIVYRRAPAFRTAREKEEYETLLRQHLVRPNSMDIWIMDADGSHKKQVTKLGGASFAPFVHPNGKQIIFSSNHHDPKGREFDLFLVNIDGSHLEQVTTAKNFDGFPMFTRDGKRLVFASNRFGKIPHETNVFVADWRP